MLKITVPGGEFWNDSLQQFVYTNEIVIQLEHSLVSVSKWEAKWKKPFISNDDKQQLSQEQVMDYIKFMTITQNVDDMVYFALTVKNLEDIMAYIQENRTATWFAKKGPEAGKRDNRAMTSERIYYFMVHYNIPFECQKWHLSRLLTLIRVCQEEEKAQNKQQKQNPRDAAMARHNLNAARRARSAKHH